MHFLAPGDDRVVTRWIIDFLAGLVDGGHMLLLWRGNCRLNLALANRRLNVHTVHMIRLRVYK